MRSSGTTASGGGGLPAADCATRSAARCAPRFAAKDTNEVFIEVEVFIDDPGSFRHVPSFLAIVIKILIEFL